MKNPMRSINQSVRAALCGTISLALLLSALAVVPQVAEAVGRGYQLQISNRSSYDIHHLYLSPTQDNNWGSDQLGENTIDSGKTHTLSAIPPDHYDIRIVDEDQDGCELRNVAITKNVSLTITDKLLQQCQ
jgi:hypothetical protein